MKNTTYQKLLRDMVKNKLASQRKVAAYRSKGMTFKEIGKVMGLSTQRVHKLYSDRTVAK